MARLPGLEPKPVTWTRVASARAAGVASTIRVSADARARRKRERFMAARYEFMPPDVMGQGPIERSLRMSWAAMGRDPHEPAGECGCEPHGCPVGVSLAWPEPHSLGTDGRQPRRPRYETATRHDRR